MLLRSLRILTSYTEFGTLDVHHVSDRAEKIDCNAVTKFGVRRVLENAHKYAPVDM